MSFQAYIDNIKAKTGKTPEDFKQLAEQAGMLAPGVKTMQIVGWLKQGFDLGHGHAMAIVSTLQTVDAPGPNTNDRVAKLFSGGRAVWRSTYDNLLDQVNEFGSDITVTAGDSYISLLRGTKKFAIVATSAQRLDVGIKLKDATPSDRFESSAGWNSMVTHRVRIDDPTKLDGEVISWLSQAYDRAV